MPNIQEICQEATVFWDLIHEYVFTLPKGHGLSLSVIKQRVLQTHKDKLPILADSTDKYAWQYCIWSKTASGGCDSCPAMGFWGSSDGNDTCRHKSSVFMDCCRNMTVDTTKAMLELCEAVEAHYELDDQYGFTQGDEVFLIKEPTMVGVVAQIDRNLPHVTTCKVIWNGDSTADVQWTDKLMKVEKSETHRLALPIAQRKWDSLVKEGAELLHYVFTTKSGRVGSIDNYGKVIWSK